MIYKGVKINPRQISNSTGGQCDECGEALGKIIWIDGEVRACTKACAVFATEREIDDIQSE